MSSSISHLERGPEMLFSTLIDTTEDIADRQLIERLDGRPSRPIAGLRSVVSSILRLDSMLDRCVRPSSVTFVLPEDALDHSPYLAHLYSRFIGVITGFAPVCAMLINSVKDAIESEDNSGES